MRVVGLALLLIGCGTPDSEFYPDITDATCWTVNGEPHVYSYIPENAVVDADFKDQCMMLGKVVESVTVEPEDDLDSLD